MATRIDTVGAYRGTITEAGLNTTKKGLPQFVCKLAATEKYVDDKESMEHFGLESPAWVDWTAYNDEIVGYLVLFNADGPLMNYEQLQLAVGWDGTEFDSLNNDSYLGKSVLFRVEENEWDGKTTLQVAWIDAANASPVRELRKIDAEGVKTLAAQFLKGVAKSSKPAVVAKPAGKSVSGVAKPAATPAKTPADSEKPSGESAKKPAPPKTQPAPTPAPEVETEPDTSELPAEISMEGAWEFVLEHKGGNTDSDIESAWISAAEEVAPGKADLTDAQWAKVRDLVIRDLALDV